MIRSLALMALCVGANASAAGLPRSFTITTFDRVRVEGPYAVSLAVGRAPSAKAEGTPAQLDAIDLRVEGRTLIIRQRSGTQSNGNSSAAVKIAVSTPDLRSAALIGAGSLSIDKLKGLSLDVGVQGPGSLQVGDVQADRLVAVAQGSGSVTLAGRIKAGSIANRGTASVDASALRATDLTLSSEGAGEVRAAASNQATVNAAGTVQIYLTGNPACQTRISGSATVSGCRSSR